MKAGNCFRCRKTGHWISDCPLKFNAEDDPPPPSIHCPCGGGLCEIKLSNTHENTGRRFYKCPAAQKCTFFKWCDEATDEDIRFRPAFTIPDCPCGSGPSRRVVADSGRAYLECGVRKGFGACGFFKWVDDVEMPPRCDDVAADEIGFWAEADLVLSDVESSFLAAGVPENTEEDSSVSDVHSAAPVNQEKLHGGDCALSKLRVDEATSGLVRDTVSRKREIICYEQPVDRTGEVAEWSLPNLQDLMEQYNSEKLQLESVSGKHAQVLSEFMSSYSRLRLLHEKTGQLRKLLLETEKEMVCCESETLELGASCREVAGEMAESQNRMQVMAAILGDEVELLKRKEFVGTKRRRC
ncbi:GRF zinc finger / Zinc knuckle protein [Raphanus sativus]|uniref:Uncharacterized protein LOC108846377 n=1 Tax=Raphanus sativus TaxID=3726 RepID=A0A6J0MRK7_RAPSA|nr:uncharacterized protein LOC108846377 [Raphanus sativus]KAJ4908415.1 GRF zinc finger / Zinc knuckle protein [Raphanus sativus]